MELTNIASVGNYFAQFVLVIILLGILISEFIKRDKNNKKGILFYIIIAIMVVISDLFNTIMTFNLNNSSLLPLITGITTAAWGIAFIINSILVWKYVNKTLFFLVILFSVITAILMSIFYITIDSNYQIIVSLSDLMSIVFGYFFIISFLINTSNKKIKNRGNK